MPETKAQHSCSSTQSVAEGGIRSTTRQGVASQVTGTWVLAVLLSLQDLVFLASVGCDQARGASEPEANLYEHGGTRRGIHDSA